MKVGSLQTSPLFGKMDENIDKATTAIQSLKNGFSPVDIAGA